MIIDAIWFRAHRCFTSEWAGFPSIRPITVIIGRNNTGKSQLLTLAEALCAPNELPRNWEYRCSSVFDEASVRRQFRPGASGGELQGDHWNFHGHRFVGCPVTWTTNVAGDVVDLEVT